MYLVINKWVTAVKVSNFSGHYLRNRSNLDIGVLGYIGIGEHKEHSPEIWHIPPVTPCIYIYISYKLLVSCFFLPVPYMNHNLTTDTCKIYTGTNMQCVWDNVLTLANGALHLSRLHYLQYTWRTVRCYISFTHVPHVRPNIPIFVLISLP